MSMNHIVSRTLRIVLTSIGVILVALAAFTASNIKADSGDTKTAEQQMIAQLSPTPITVQINSPTPLPQIVESVTPTFTPAAEELQTLPLLEAKKTAGEVNVRFEANIDSELVGTIAFGTQYVVTGRYLRWYRIAFEESRDGTGWVFDELVDVIGDTSTIPDLALTPVPTTDPTLAGATQTAAVLVLTPGAALTATASVREITGPVAAINADGTTVVDPLGTPLAESTPLPTFTYPPEVALLATTDPGVGDAAVEPTTPPPLTLTPDDVPPILPIVVLGGFGLLGLAVASVRR
jgi:hypothetical protein